MLRPSLKWTFGRLCRRSLHLFRSKVYRDQHADTHRSIIVAGAGRSGTTWLGEVIASQGPWRLMFEPFHPQQVADYSLFNYFQYMRPNEDNRRLLAYTHRVLTGDIRHPWIDGYVEHLFPKYRLIKDIRICLLLRWIREHFPDVPIVFIIRHPCAVVSSRLKLKWATDHDIEPFLQQPQLIEDFLSSKLPVIRGATTDEQKHAIVWSVSNLVPLEQFRDDGLKVVFYEDLLLRPESEIPALFEALNLPFGPSVYRYLHRASMKAVRDSAVIGGRDAITGWRRFLSEQQINNILDVVRAFGLDHLYGNADTPSQLNVSTHR